MVFLSYLFTLVIFTLIILAAEEIGSFFLKIFKFNFLRGLEKKILAQGIGLGFLAIFIFLIGLEGYLKGIFIWLPVVIFALLALRRFRIPSFKTINFDKIEKFLLLVFVGFIIVNLIGVFAPEIGFDALYYHLTLPKIYFMKGKIFPLKGLFYYVFAWPKITEMLYLLGISLNNSSLARLFHFYFGIATAFLVFLFGRKFSNKKTGILASVAFYSMPVVSWLSTSGYVDLTPTFYITLASGLIFSLASNKKSDILIGLIYGFALGAKILVLVYLPGFLLIFFLKRGSGIIRKIKEVFFFFLGLLAAILPWHVACHFWAGSLIYPYLQLVDFAKLGKQNLFGLQDNIFLRFIYNFYQAFFRPDDHLTPLPLIFLPLTLFCFKKLKKDIKFLALLVFLYSLVWAVFVWNSNRYLLPFFPLLIILSLSFYPKISQSFFKKYLAFLTILVSLFCLLYRTVAVLPRIKVFLGLEKPNEFLTRFFPKEELVFIDKDGFFRNLAIKKEKPILIIGTHQLFYIDFPFEHISWAPKDQTYSYVLVQRGKLPEGLGQPPLVYEDKSNNIKLYKFDRSLK